MRRRKCVHNDIVVAAPDPLIVPRQFLRKKLIGKTVRVKVDFIRPAEGQFEERECATIKYGGANVSVLVRVRALFEP